MKPLKASGTTTTSNDNTESERYFEEHVGNSHMAGDHKIDMYNFSACVMLSKPILALKFTQMKLVDAPIALFPAENSINNTVHSCSISTIVYLNFMKNPIQISNLSCLCSFNYSEVIPYRYTDC